MSKKIIRYLTSVIFIVGLLAASQILKHEEIIFPEMLAIVIGLFAADSRPWNITGIKLLIIMSISSIAGLIISLFMPGSLFIKIAAALITATFIYFVSKTRLTPLISAIVLPVMLSEKSIVYPIAVFIMVLLAVLIAFLMEKEALTSKKSHTYSTEDVCTCDHKRWIIQLILLLIYIGILMSLSQTFLFVPPLIVSYFTIGEIGLLESDSSNDEIVGHSFAKNIPNDEIVGHSFAKNIPNDMKASHIKSDSKMIIREHIITTLQKLCPLILIMLSASILGIFARLILTQHFGFSMIISGSIAAAILILIMRGLKTFFPPAGALLLLPYLLPLNNLVFYPIKTFIGFISMLLLLKISILISHGR